MHYWRIVRGSPFPWIPRPLPSMASAEGGVHGDFSDFLCGKAIWKFSRCVYIRQNFTIEAQSTTSFSFFYEIMGFLTVQASALRLQVAVR